MAKVNILEIFKANWCGHCQQLSGVLDSLQPILKKQGVETRIYDSEKDSTLFKQNGITYYPTMYYYNSNGEKKEIHDKSADSILHEVGISPGMMVGGSNDVYFNKYLKYKNKYLELKGNDVKYSEGGGGLFSGSKKITPKVDSTYQKGLEQFQKNIKKFIPQHVEIKDELNKLKKLAPEGLINFIKLMNNIKGIKKAKKFNKNINMYSSIVEKHEVIGLMATHISSFNKDVKNSVEEIYWLAWIANEPLKDNTGKKKLDINSKEVFLSREEKLLLYARFIVNHDVNNLNLNDDEKNKLHAFLLLTLIWLGSKNEKDSLKFLKELLVFIHIAVTEKSTTDNNKKLQKVQDLNSSLQDMKNKQNEDKI